MIEFDPNGVVLNANENFLKTVQYSLDEIVGQHHSLFCHRSEVESPAYKAFWASLNRGEYHAHRFERKNKYGKTLFLEESYSPIFDTHEVRSLAARTSQATVEVQEGSQHGVDAIGQFNSTLQLQ
jgi:methyl-accepting chemotaxis protein